MTKTNSNFYDYLAQSQNKLNGFLDSFRKPKILVVGDLTLDEFLTGEVERLSREAPVLILRHEYTEQIPGGGANAIYNLAKMGANLKVAGIVGNDAQGEALKGIFADVGIDITGILTDEKRPTVTKTRIVGHARQSVSQQIVRVDRKSDQLPDLELQQQLADYISSQLSGVDAVVCSDYGDGVFTQSVIEASLNHSKIIVDTQKDLQRFQKATLFTPNLPEAEQAVGYSIKDENSLLKAGADLLNLTQAQQILITRGEEGMSLFEKMNQEVRMKHIPAFNRTDVFDVTGAGDTVVAALTLGLCVGADFFDASILGNLAASIVVRHFGTATTTSDEMKETLKVLLEEISLN
jgi:D-glycero-beta-D-manno-heptose-7-phosphate kinase